jgi:hypothetical protein
MYRILELADDKGTIELQLGRADLDLAGPPTLLLHGHGLLDLTLFFLSPLVGTYTRWYPKPI